MKKIYFAGAITIGNDKYEDYIDLIDFLSDYGEILTKNIWNEDLSHVNNYEEKIYQRHKKWMDEADLIIADISLPSIGVGYELSYFEAHNKPSICLYDENSPKRLNCMIAGNKYHKIIKYKDLKEVKEKLKEIL
ncbi:MAG: nucleoside 2-deoxyribosyltransferase [Mollicutes bacterium]|nr:nucleoside 2-deoxyribosyltransferase [Mollicutes bacterium]